MAIYPCRIGNHRYPQPQQLAYCTHLVNDYALTYRARLCPKHFRAVTQVGEEMMDRVHEDSVSSDDCGICSEAKTEALFLRCFPNKNEEQVFALDACGTCGSQVLERLQVATWEVLAAR